MLTGSLFREISKIRDPAQRTLLMELIGELTEFTYLAGPPDIFRLELQAVLDIRTNSCGLGLAPIDLLGKSALHPFGRVGGVRVMRDGQDVTGELLADDAEFASRLEEMNRIAERMLLAGPVDADIPGLQANGYLPEVPEQQVRDNAVFEEAWSLKFGPYRANEVLRDFVIARHVSLELIDMLNLELNARQISLDRVFAGRVDARSLVMSMPSSAVMVSLLAQYHQDPNKKWTQNDVYDIEALTVAVPYCDVVFTDAAARDALLRRDLDVLMGTIVPRRPEDLTELLDELSSPEDR